jgi:hypothetical protein
VADPLGSRISLLRETAWSFFFFTQDELHSLIDEYYLRAGALLSTPLLSRYLSVEVNRGDQTSGVSGPRLADIFSRGQQMNEPNHGQAYDSFYYL